MSYLSLFVARSLVCLMGPIILCLPPLPPSVFAQETIHLSIGLDSFFQDRLPSDFFDEFEAMHDNVEVHVVEISRATILNPLTDGEAYDEQLQDYASRVDVLSINDFDNLLWPEATRRGYWLDLTPLLSVDADFDPRIFYPAAWQHYQWDGGTWALPVSSEPMVVIYDEKVFDELGLAYPNAEWTLDQYIHAYETILSTHPEGSAGNIPLLLTALNPLETITLDDASLIASVERWLTLNPDPTLTNSSVGLAVDEYLPLFVGRMSTLSYMRSDSTWRAAPLPGSVTDSVGGGYAISGGTAYPELAYELAKFVVQNPRDIAVMRQMFPARVDLPPRLTSSLLPLFEEVQQNPLPGSVSRLTAVLQRALERLANDDKLAASVVLSQAASETDLPENPPKVQIVVDTPDIVLPLDPGKIELRFGYGSEWANDREWQAAIDAFTSTDPQVGRIVFDKTLSLDYDSYDCFYLSYDGVDPQRIESYVSLDPFFATDPTFERADFVPGVLEPLQLNDQIWAYPVTLTTYGLSYDAEQLSELRIPRPEVDWTTNDFATTLASLHTAQPTTAGLSLPGLDINEVLALVAAYDGLLIDMTTVPPTLNFTQPQALNATQQVLDLAKAGLILYPDIGYGPLDKLGYSSQRAFLIPRSDQLMAQTSLEAVNYPRGTQYAPMVIGDVSGLYISVRSRYPEACYRWIATIARRADLFFGMPARQSVIDAPMTVLAYSDSLVSFYQHQAERLSDPEAVIFTSQFSGGQNRLDLFLYSLWLGRAMDSYMFNNVALSDAMETAQQLGTDFQACAGEALVTLAWDEQPILRRCAADVDPLLRERFGG